MQAFGIFLMSLTEAFSNFEYGSETYIFIHCYKMGQKQKLNFKVFSFSLHWQLGSRGNITDGTCSCQNTQLFYRWSHAICSISRLLLILKQSIQYTYTAVLCAFLNKAGGSLQTKKSLEEGGKVSPVMLKNFKTIYVQKSYDRCAPKLVHICTL